MTTNAVDIVKRYIKAFETKNEKVLRETLHPNYTFEGPMMKFSSLEECVQFAMNCPFEHHSTNKKFIADGNTVVQTFDSVVTKPFQATIRMCEVSIIEDNKILKAELFYDTAKFPKEAMEAMGKAA